jgi:ATP-dependent Clp protease adapter protein ClpS
MECVVRALVRIVGLGTEDAVAKMLQAHHTGQAVVATVHAELAEHYASALEASTRLDDLRGRGRGLRVTVHPA